MLLNAHPAGNLVILPELPGCGVREYKTPPRLNNVFPSEVHTEQSAAKQQLVLTLSTVNTDLAHIILRFVFSGLYM